MKTFFLSYLAIMWNLIELLFEPLIFVTVGLIFEVSWQYYLITIGGYYALMLIWELVCFVLFRNSEKKFHCPLVRRLKKMAKRFSEESTGEAE